MGFDGLVVSDWNGIGQVAGLHERELPAGHQRRHRHRDGAARLEGVHRQHRRPGQERPDPDGADRRRGDPHPAREAARRAVRPAPAVRARARRATRALDHRALARKAVRKSLVLLKNKGNLLPLRCSAKVLVVGKSADTLPNQTGGWSLTWQGTGNTNADFPNGTTILAGLRAALGAANVTFDEDGEGVDPSQYDAVVAVIGETPYAEGVGDIGRRSLEAAQLYPGDLATLDRVSGKGAPVATVFVSGRPLYVNKELNRSDAFVAAWLPGTEGQRRGRPAGQGSADGRRLHRQALLQLARRAVPDAAQRRRRGVRAAVPLRLRPPQRADRERRDPAGGDPSRAASTRAAAGPPPRTWCCSTASIRTRTSPTSARRSTGAARSSATTRAP